MRIVAGGCAVEKELSTTVKLSISNRCSDLAVNEARHLVANGVVEECVRPLQRQCVVDATHWRRERFG